MTKLPREGRSQEIGRLAGRALGNKLPKSWIEKELDGDSDFGIDYFVQLKNRDDYVAFSFYLQLKGTTVPSYSADKQYISYNFKVSTLRFYHQQEPLVMVAIVDLMGNEDKLWECPVYYIWLDENWFCDNKNKLESQDTISIKIPTEQLLNQSLNVYDFYSKRVKEKFAVAELENEIKSHTDDFVQSIGTLTEAISEKPMFLKAVEVSGDEPWIENPKGEIPTLLKECSDSINSNQLIKSNEILAQLDEYKLSFTSHELAEYYFQEAAILSMQGDYLQANEKLKCSVKLSDKDRYKLGYIESKFKLSELPNEAELIKIAQSLPVHSFQNTIVKAKCLALTGNAGEALMLLKNNFPNKIVGQMMILVISNDLKAVEEIIHDFDKSSLENDRDRYIYHLIVARMAYVKANSYSIDYGKVVPIQGQVSVCLEGMKEAYENLVEAWNSAKRLGYPSDITMLFDISPFVFSYFNRLEDLFYHFEQILSERPNHSILIKTYSRLLFNEHQHERVIDLLNRVSPDFDIDDYGMLILSNYYLKRPRIALNLLKKQEERFLEEQPENYAIIFCVGAEIAQELLDEELSEKYFNVVKNSESGEALLSISNFIKKANAEPSNRATYVNDLYEDYIRLEKPVAIAEQLFRYLNPEKLTTALQIIEIADDLMSVHDLFERDYFHLAQALITKGDFEKSLAISEKHLDKISFDPNWHIIKVVSLQRMGKIGLAYDEIKSSLDENRFSSEHLKQYVHICLQFGLLTEVEEALIDLLNSSEGREEKLSFLSNLISIYSLEKGFSDKLSNAVKRFGNLVNREDCAEEGQFLIYFLMSPKNRNNKDIAEFKQRLANYTAKFPDSNILKQGTIDLDNGPEALLNSINKMTGITEEQLTQWEQNKNKIRNGSLPVPFVMLERFLRDTRDLFTTWVFSNNTPEDQLEFKLNQAPQLDQVKFQSIFQKNKSVIIEDSSLLILNEIGMLGKFLGEIDEFCLLESTFTRISQNNHPLAGSIYCYIPQQILQTINEHKTKLRLISEDSDTPFDAIQQEIKLSEIFFLTDDVNLLRLVAIGEGVLHSINSYNVIEYLFNQSIITEKEKYTFVSNICSFGIHQPNMSINLLADALTFFTCMINGVDYTESGFKNIFDKVFSRQRVTVDVIQLFFRTLFTASKNPKFQFNSDTLISLFRGLLIRHPYKSLESFTALWFIYQCMITRVDIETKFIATSTKHVELWHIYKEIIYKIPNNEFTTHDLVLNVINQIYLLDEKHRAQAYQHIKSCFSPLTEEAELFEKIYSDGAISYQLKFRT